MAQTARTQLQPNLFGFTPSLFDAFAAEEKTDLFADAYAAQFEQDEDEEGYVELLAYEAEVRAEYAQNCRFGIYEVWA